MFGFLKGFGQRNAFWWEDSSMAVAVLVGAQLDEVGRTKAKTWGQDQPMILGYVCGAAERLCADEGKRRRAADLSTMTVANLTGAPFEVARDALIELQDPLNAGYHVGHMRGWADWPDRKAASGLVDLLKVMDSLGPFQKQRP